jgi:hypothetical protein
MLKLSVNMFTYSLGKLSQIEQISGPASTHHTVLNHLTHQKYVALACIRLYIQLYIFKIYTYISCTPSASLLMVHLVCLSTGCTKSVTVQPACDHPSLSNSLIYSLSFVQEICSSFGVRIALNFLLIKYRTLIRSS